ncbi:MAG: hypothetical protein [Bacteriophage sp.]|jgi:hypothetical protein|nr:MAG: hypothetical protein [Bacteriophage sp.]UWG14872.1 MAG: hypothetical protein [Bacteriophage sp.]UWG67432.1 MAG: hypothetical protein [Bacteriophage sp.]UWI08866.1 MAG: hypothetical protein [Bacteriophage sp.]
MVHISFLLSWCVFGFLPDASGVVGSGRFSVRPVKVSGAGSSPLQAAFPPGQTPGGVSFGTFAAFPGGGDLVRGGNGEILLLAAGIGASEKPFCIAHCVRSFRYA